MIISYSIPSIQFNSFIVIDYRSIEYTNIQTNIQYNQLNQSLRVHQNTHSKTISPPIFQNTSCGSSPSDLSNKRSEDNLVL